jgi:hypothetical protein
VVTRRKFGPEATLDLIDRDQAKGLAVVPVMFDRIMELLADVRNRYSGSSLRFARHPVHGCDPTLSSRSWTNSATSSTTGKVLRSELQSRVSG